MDYKEKLRLAKEALDSGSYDNETIEYIFPELKESEDERIRKEMISWLKGFIGEEEGCGYTEDEIKERIAWVEKQGEQNIKMIQWKGDNLREVVDFTGKSPKFNEWFKTWDDYENYVRSHGNIFKLFWEDGSHYEVPEGAWILKTPDGYNVASKATYINKLKQKPTWSEEDERMFNDIILCLDGNFKSYKSMINWLKSFKERYTWKPSDEQMKSLWKYAEQNNYDGTILTSLYQDLKKLRKE